jgi:phosphate uptake regulator
MTRDPFHQDLYEIELDVLKLAALVMPGIVNLLLDIQQGDRIFAHEVIAGCIAVIAAQHRITQRCIVFRECWSPATTIVQHLAVMKRVSRELEQMSRSAVKIALYMTHLQYRSQLHLPPALDHLTQLTLEQVRTGIQIFIERKMQRAQDLFATNEALEAQYWQVVQALREQSGHGFSAAVMTASIFLLLTNELDSLRERVAVICDQAIYPASGEVPTIA